MIRCTKGSNCFAISPLQAFFEAGVATGDGEVPDGKPEGFGTADKDADAFCSGDAGVDEIALEHHVVGHQDGNYNNRELRTLGLVDGGGVGQGNFVQLGVVILNFAAVKVDGKGSVLSIDGADITDETSTIRLGNVIKNCILESPASGNASDTFARIDEMTTVPIWTTDIKSIAISIFFLPFTIV